MLTAAQITAGNARLVAGKLTAVDVDQAASILSMDTFFGGLIETYGYEFKDRLAEFDDVANPDDQIAAQIAACLIKLEELGFGVALLKGGVEYKEKDEYWQYVQIIFLKMYTLPQELAKYSLARSSRYGRRASQTARSVRVQGCLPGEDYGSEAYIRRFGRRAGGF